MLMIDIVPDFGFKPVHVGVLWSVVALAFYYGFHMIFFNTLSADLTANETDKWIDNAQDLLYDETFKNFRPTIFSQLNMVKVLECAPNDSDERAIYNKALEEKSIITFDLTSETMMGDLLTVFDDAENYTRAIIEDSTYLDPVIDQVVCHMMIERAEKIVKSKQSLYSAPMAMLLSHSTNRHVVELYIYRSLTSIEFGIVKGLKTHKLEDVLIQMGMSKNIKGYQCADVIFGILIPDLEKGWDPLPFEFFS